MNTFYASYYWKKGRPYGKKKRDQEEQAFKIVSDPYHKRISIEKYFKGDFSSIIYDSNLFDFRALKPQEQVGWEKEIVQEGESSTNSLMRDHNDRVILIEENNLEKGWIRSCTIKSPQGILIGRQHLYYESLGDPWSGVILYDCNKSPVMKKIYSSREDGAFLDVIEECWDFST